MVAQGTFDAQANTTNLELWGLTWEILGTISSNFSSLKEEVVAGNDSKNSSMAAAPKSGKELKTGPKDSIPDEDEKGSGSEEAPKVLDTTTSGEPPPAYETVQPPSQP